MTVFRPTAFRRTALLSLVGMTAILGACANTTGLVPNTGSGGNAATARAAPTANPYPSFARFTDLPMPSNAELDLERSLVFGGEESWTGRLVLNTNSSPSDMYDFYLTEMPNFGWSKITVVRSKTNVMVFDRESRVATITILEGRLRGTVIDVTVAPRAENPGIS